MVLKDGHSFAAGGATSMHRAAYCGHGDVVRLLMREGADGGKVDSDGKTPLHKATLVLFVDHCLNKRPRNCLSLGFSYVDNLLLCRTLQSSL